MDRNKYLYQISLIGKAVKENIAGREEAKTSPDSSPNDSLQRIVEHTTFYSRINHVVQSSSGIVVKPIDMVDVC